jgi:hypothetical protein
MKLLFAALLLLATMAVAQGTTHRHSPFAIYVVIPG